MKDRQTPEAARDGEQAAQEDTHAPTVRSEDLLRGTRELRIIHGKEIYRLQLTRNNRLILHK
jgi:hemin uptake protein HemP